MPGARTPANPDLRGSVRKPIMPAMSRRLPDMESMVRDLLQLAINMVTKEEEEGVTAKAAAAAEERLLDLLLPPAPKQDSAKVESGSDREKEKNNPADVIELSYHKAFGQDAGALCQAPPEVGVAGDFGLPGLEGLLPGRIAGKQAG